MNTAENNDRESSILKLRVRAEKILKDKPVSEMMSLKKEILVHELSVYQIELELQAEELRTTNERLQTVFESNDSKAYDLSNVGMATIDNFGVIIKMNLRAAAILKHDRNDMLKKNLLSFFASNSMPVFREFIMKIFEKKENSSCRFELDFAGLEPQYIYLEGMVAEGGKTCLLNVMDA